MLLCMFGTTVKAGKESKTGWFSEGQYLRKSNLTLLWEDYEKAFSSQKKSDQSHLLWWWPRRLQFWRRDFWLQVTLHRIKTKQKKSRVIWSWLWRNDGKHFWVQNLTIAKMYLGMSSCLCLLKSFQIKPESLSWICIVAPRELQA